MSGIYRTLIIFHAIRSFLYRKVIVRHIKDDDLVLDIGSGDKPFWRADVFVDLYPEDDQQRFSGSVVYDKKKLFVNANVERLPFKDKSFDFVFCSHLLEHVEHPDRAIAEITRVGKRGYIEVPRTILDALSPFPPHLWFCELEGRTLVFRRKEKERNIFLASMENFGHTFFNSALLQFLFIKHFDASFVCLYWINTVNFRIEKIRGEPYNYVYKADTIHRKDVFSNASHAAYKLIYTVLNVLYYKEKHVNREAIFKT